MKKAFTLIEMLVVIGIIMVLAGASLAAFQGVTKSAERARAQELVSNAATALTMLFDTDGAWPAVIRNTGAVDGRLDERAALPLAKRGFLSATMNDNQTALSGLDKFGLVTPWATTAIKRKGSSPTLSTKVNGSSTIQDHILHFAVDLDGDGIIRKYGNIILKKGVTPIEG